VALWAEAEQRGARAWCGGGSVGGGSGNLRKIGAGWVPGEWRLSGMACAGPGSRRNRAGVHRAGSGNPLPIVEAARPDTGIAENRCGAHRVGSGNLLPVRAQATARPLPVDPCSDRVLALGQRYPEEMRYLGQSSIEPQARLAEYQRLDRKTP